MTLSKEERKELATQIKRLIKAAGTFNLTKREPEEPNYELILQLLDGLGKEVEDELPTSLMRKVWAYRYRKYHLFLEVNVVPLAVKVNKHHLVGVEVDQDVIVNKFLDRYVTENPNKDIKSYSNDPAYLIFLPPFATFSETLQDQILWFHERSSYANYAKFLNLNKPAINLKFHIKHKYVLKKDLDEKVIIEMLEGSLDELHTTLTLYQNPFSNTELTEDDIVRVKAKIQFFDRILKNIDKYEFSKSNYDKNYSYLTLDYRYIKPDAATTSDLDNDQVQVSRKRAANFIFVNQDLIDENLPNRHKTVHKYLAQCNELFIKPRMTYYYKEKDK
ncbi:hypothetical protein [uncultured Microscilla sp.]|uniref:hypothetical protein n=1 Tax=uncultured Microscilla sp. TaxID=432653 RepID=UPI00261B04BC|nr:hypothetical protein [uncultured Microscilla sp.]